MRGDEIELLWPFPCWRELWVYDKNSLNKTQYVYDSYWPTEKNLEALLDYQYEINEQGRIIFEYKELKKFNTDPYHDLHSDYRPDKNRYEYDINGNILIEYDLNGDGDIYQYYIYTYENDRPVKIDHYFAENNQFINYVLLYYDDSGLLVKRLSYSDSDNTPSHETIYEYDKDGRLIVYNAYTRYYRYFY